MENKANVDQFAMELFLDDSVSTMNRVIVAIANVVSDNVDNIRVLDNVLKTEYCELYFNRKENENVHRARRRVRSVIRQNSRFYEDIVLNYDDETFIEKFKMTRSTVQKLTEFLTDSMKNSRNIVPLDKKIHIFLWLMTCNASYNEVAKLFGLHKSSICYIFHEIASVISEQRYNFITWPSEEEQHVTRVKVNSYFKFPNCVGFIDACRFKIPAMRKRRYSSDVMLLQAVCDENYMFLDVHVGDVGTTKKGRLFKESPLAHELKNFIDFENHILGDSDYKLKNNLITPFTSEELLTSEEMKFNEVHLKTHNYISRAFERLRDKFIRLNCLDVTKPEYVKSILIAACVLYNFVLITEGSPEVKEEVDTCADGVSIDKTIVQSAIEKRQFLCNYINIIDSTSCD